MALPTPTPAVPQQGTPPSPQMGGARPGQAISLSGLVQEAKDNATRILDQYNSNPTLKALGISFIADPQNPGRLIQVQGQTPTQQIISQQTIEKGNIELGAENLSKTQAAMKQLEGETGKMYSTEKATLAIKLSNQGVDVGDIMTAIGAPDTYKQAELLGFNMEKADTAIKSAKQRWDAAGGGKGVLAWITHPEQAIAFNRTKGDTAIALAKALTNSSAGQSRITEMVKGSIPSVGEPVGIANATWNQLLQQLKAVADDYNLGTTGSPASQSPTTPQAAQPTDQGQTPTNLPSGWKYLGTQ